MRNLKETIKDFPVEMELHQFGKEFKEFQMVEMKNLQRKEKHDNYKKFQLLVFRRYMIGKGSIHNYL